jgi:hypothetical protein
VCKQVTVCPGNIATTLYIGIVSISKNIPAQPLLCCFSILQKKKLLERTLHILLIHIITVRDQRLRLSKGWDPVLPTSDFFSNIYTASAVAGVSPGPRKDVHNQECECKVYLLNLAQRYESVWQVVVHINAVVSSALDASEW